MVLCGISAASLLLKWLVKVRKSTLEVDTLVEQFLVELSYRIVRVVPVVAALRIRIAEFEKIGDHEPVSQLVAKR
jgi:hypothetical protein